MAAAKRYVALVSAHDDLIASSQNIASFVLAHDHGGLLPAVANGADFAHLIGQSEQRGRGGEQSPPKVHTQAVGHNGHVQIIDDAGKLPNMIRRHEVRLVEKHTSTWPCVQPRFDHIEQVVFCAKGIGLCADPNPAANATNSGTVIKAGDHQIRLHAPLNVIVRRLQEHGRFARVHGGIVEIQFGHVN